MRIIAGPCQHETFEQSLEIASHCSKICADYNMDYYFKASFDKANRTNAASKRGLGLSRTLTHFKAMKHELPDLKLVTDVHELSHITHVKDIVDVIQIPAFLCRQTDLIIAACNTGRIVNIKKGQFLAPWDVAGILSKTNSSSRVWITERGTSFGYNNLVVDFTGMQYIMEHYDVPLIFDATHSVQKPGGAGSSSTGTRSYVPGLCRAASALGISNFFLEVHPDPDNAPSDGPNMLHLCDFESTMKQIREFHFQQII